MSRIVLLLVCSMGAGFNLAISHLLEVDDRLTLVNLQPREFPPASGRQPLNFCQSGIFPF